MKKKNKTPLDKLSEEIEEYLQDGLLKTPSKSFLEKLESRITEILTNVFNKISIQESNMLSYALKKEYRRHFRDLKTTHKGLSSYKLEDLQPKLLKAYKSKVANNLALIKTQNNANMNKLKARYLSWINLQSVGGDKEKLKDYVKLEKNKRLKFVIRDQSNKLTSTMDEIIADYYGWIAMQWKTRNDNKVVGKPSGLYPKVTDDTMHGNHWERKDKFYYNPKINKTIKNKLKLSKFNGEAIFEDGMPGNPIGCRCYAVFYYDIEDLPKGLIKQ